MKKKKKKLKLRGSALPRSGTIKPGGINIVVHVDSSKKESSPGNFGENEADRSLKRMRYKNFL